VEDKLKTNADPSAGQIGQPDSRDENGDVVHADRFGCVDGFAYDLARAVTVGDQSRPPR
jgi:hypothetical protein